MNVTAKTQRRKEYEGKEHCPRIRGIVSNPPGFLALKPLRLCVLAVYELFRIVTREN